MQHHIDDVGIEAEIALGWAHVGNHDKTFRPIVIESEDVRVIAVQQMEFAMEYLLIDLGFLAKGDRVFIKGKNGVGVHFLNRHVHALDVILIHFIAILIKKDIVKKFMKIIVEVSFLKQLSLKKLIMNYLKKLGI